MESDVLEHVEWALEQERGEETFDLLRTDTGYRLKGVIEASKDGDPVHVTYQIDCDPGWRTRAVHIEVDQSGAHRVAHLETDGQGNWRGNLPNIDKICGCIDVDLEYTPATNLLPLRRLRLRPGASAEIRTVWVRFPELNVQPLRQTYTQLSEHRVRYESETGFQADIEVDAWGLAIQYGEIWARKPGSKEPPCQN